MGLSNEEQILIPFKFISIMTHLIITTMNFFSYHDNIVAAYPELTFKNSVYNGAATSFLASNSLITIFLAIEMFLLLLGVNLFRQKLSVFVSSIHFIGAILGSVLTYTYWEFDFNWVLWFLFSFIPLFTEILNICTSPKKTL